MNQPSNDHAHSDCSEAGSPAAPILPMTVQLAGEPFNPLVNSSDQPTSRTQGASNVLREIAVQRDDQAWASAAAAFLQARRLVEQAEAALLRAREGLVALTSHPIEQGCGVTVTMPDEWRRADNARTTELLKVDLERYWGKGCVGATVSVDQ